MDSIVLVIQAKRLDSLPPASRLRSARQERLNGPVLCTVLRTDTVGRLGIGVQRHTSVLAASIHDVEVHVEVWFATAVQKSPFRGRRLDSPQRFHAGVFGTHAAAHVLHDQEGTEVIETRFTPARRSSRAYFAINIQAGSQKRRRAHPPRNFPGP